MSRNAVKWIAMIAVLIGVGMLQSRADDQPPSSYLPVVDNKPSTRCGKRWKRRSQPSMPSRKSCSKSATT